MVYFKIRNNMMFGQAKNITHLYLYYINNTVFPNTTNNDPNSTLIVITIPNETATLHTVVSPFSLVSFYFLSSMQML